MENTPESMSKGDFANLISVSGACVSQYLKSGKIYGDAIVGQGHRARIRPDIAIRQLELSIDPSQGLGANGKAFLNGASGRQKTQKEKDVPEAPASELPLHQPSAQDAMAEQLARERLRQQQIKTGRMERQELEEAGIYTRSEDARRDMGRGISEAFKVMEQGIPDLATALAEEFGLPQRDLQKALARRWRGIRSKAASGFRDIRDETPEMIEDEEAYETT
ncbi:hypothetical protein EDC90_10192 [Martelella mediterranea]|uniref:Uncharacterized protein n=2 Tax=Martelella mediterranea TaxID=293089 RepID=A0A4R3NUP6_9HYPH|nr:hypothetical protein EDC90_10192 [Martelella mediterranea]